MHCSSPQLQYGTKSTSGWRWQCAWKWLPFWQSMRCDVQVLKVVPRHKEALERLARLWLRVGRLERALEVADRAAAAHAADFAAHALRGDVLMCARAVPCTQHPARYHVPCSYWLFKCPTKASCTYLKKGHAPPL